MPVKKGPGIGGHYLWCYRKTIDHTLKNLSVLLQFNPVFSSIRIIDRFSTIRMIESPFREDFPLNTSVSLFPLSGRVEGITTRAEISAEEGFLKTEFRTAVRTKR
jgi:thiamine pyrophosphokinase